MKDPERLLLSDSTNFERFVLRAARSEQPSPSHRRRMRRALFLAEFAFLTSGVKAAAAATANHFRHRRHHRRYGRWFGIDDSDA
ncbi:MAG: hypothetical protein QM784_18165 [Polyangiaceae bacterium]